MHSSYWIIYLQLEKVHLSSEQWQKTFVATSYVSVTMQSNHKVKTRDKQQAAVTLLRISIPTHTALSDRTIRAQCLSLHVLL